MTHYLRVLIVDDSADDAYFLQRTLTHGGYEVISEIVDTEDAMRSALKEHEWDVITSDHSMPQFNAQAALNISKELCPDIPFIIVSGEIDLNLAVSLMKSGAKDFIQKRELIRIIPVIERELEESELRRTKQKADRQLLESEIRYRRLFESAQDGILILDGTTGFVIDVNPFLITMLEYSKEEFIGKELWELGAFSDKDTSKQAFLELKTKKYIRYDNLPLLTKNGIRKAVEFVSNVYLVDGVKIVQCNIRDITDRENSLLEIIKLNEELERRVRERTSQLELVNLELESFNYSVSHDLRTPLRHIKGYTDALQEDISGRLSEESTCLLDKIRDSMDRMDLLITAFLSLSKYSQLEIRHQKVDLTKIVHTIAHDLVQNNPARQVEFKIGEGIVASGDEQLLGIVLENLVCNAWKFTSNRADSVIEFGTLQQQEGIVYYVRDNGVGFNMDYAENLFTAFKRLHSEKEFPGIGIGLATVARIIRHHGGRIWAESKVGNGATFYFTVEPA